MRNGNMTDKLRIQERELKATEQNFAGEKKKTVDIQTDENIKAQTNKNIKAFSDTSIQQYNSKQVKTGYPLYFPYLHRLRTSIR